VPDNGLMTAFVGISYCDVLPITIGGDILTNVNPCEKTLALKMKINRIDLILYIIFFQS
jgi:hypothetical protein